MGGVDRGDQLRQYYHVLYKSINTTDTFFGFYLTHPLRMSSSYSAATDKKLTLKRFELSWQRHS